LLLVANEADSWVVPVVGPPNLEILVDAAVLILAAVLFSLTWGLVRLCEKL